MTPKIKNIIPNINNITIGIANPKIPLFIEAPLVATDKGKTKNKIKIIHNVKDIFDIKDILALLFVKVRSWFVQTTIYNFSAIIAIVWIR